MTLPDAPDGWRAMRTVDGRPRFDSEDRTLTIVCEEVSTHAGDVFNCRLFEGEKPYQMGEPTTGAIAESLDEVPEIIRHLDPNQ